MAPLRLLLKRSCNTLYDEKVLHAHSQFQMHCLILLLVIVSLRYGGTRGCGLRSLNTHRTGPTLRLSFFSMERGSYVGGNSAGVTLDMRSQGPSLTDVWRLLFSHGIIVLDES